MAGNAHLGDANYKSFLRESSLHKGGRFSNKVKVGNWMEDRVQQHYQGDILANIQPLSYDWDITGKVGHCDDFVRKKQYQEKMLTKLSDNDCEVPDPCLPRQDHCFRPVFGKALEPRGQRYRYTPYNELDDPRWSSVFDNHDIDNSNDMKANFDGRGNHRVYEGMEPTFKVPAICQHKRDFYPVNVNWGLALKKRKDLAQWKHLDDNRFLTSYTAAYGPNEVRFAPPYVDPPNMPKQKALVFYRRPEMLDRAEEPISPAMHIRPPRCESPV